MSPIQLMSLVPPANSHLQVARSTTRKLHTSPPQPEERKESEGKPVTKKDMSLEPKRVELPLPGQELRVASASFQGMLRRLESEAELYKLHVKHYHMSPAQFRRRTTMLKLPKPKCDEIVKSCEVSGTSVLSPPRARISLRASEFGDFVFVDHQEIQALNI